MRRKSNNHKTVTTSQIFRAVFKWLSKVITWLRLRRLVIGLKHSRQFFNLWEAKPKPIAPYVRDFSRASSELQIIARNCDWLMELFVPVVIGRSNCFGFGFSTVIWKPPYFQVTFSMASMALLLKLPNSCYCSYQRFWLTNEANGSFPINNSYYFFSSTYLSFVLGCALADKSRMKNQTILGGVMFSLQSPGGIRQIIFKPSLNFT